MKFCIRRFSFLFLLMGLLNPLSAQLTKYMHDTLPAQWIEGELFEQTLPADDKWWQNFNDPLLEKLMVKVISNNYDILMAADRMDMAKAQMRMAQSGFYPQLGIQASWTPQMQSVGLNPALGLNMRETQPGSATIGMSWEIDIIGSVRNRAKAQKEMFKVSQAEYNGVMISLCSELASYYMNLRAAQKQLLVANANILSQKDVMEIVDARFAAGLVSKLDVAQASSVYESTRAMVPPLEANIMALMNGISVLLGELPWVLRSELEVFNNLPIINTKIAVGVPAEIIRQRPDVTAAERTVLSRAASLGATKADWWPKFYIDASFGYGSRNFEKFVNSDNMMWQIGPTLRWNIFTGLQQNQNTKAARENLDMSVNGYNKTILVALGEVDNAMNFYAKSIDQIKACQRAEDQAVLTLDLSLDLYKQGLIDFQNVLDAQRYLLNYQNATVEAQSNSLQRLIDLYRALGGGWQVNN